MKITVGKIFPLWRGKYSETETYNAWDVVFYNNETYMVKIDVKEGIMGVAPTDDTKWQQTSWYNEQTKFIIEELNNKSDKQEVNSLKNKYDELNQNKVNKDEVTNVLTPKGNSVYASLPSSNNAIGDYYYCSDGDGVNGAGNYVWNGTSWYFGGTGDEGYSELKNTKVDSQTSYEIAIETYYALKRTGKIYSSKVWLYNTNPTSSCEKMDDNIGLEYKPYTDTEDGIDDYADIPLFQWKYCNYIRDDYGLPHPIAIEGDKNFKWTGSGIDVGAMQMSFYVKIDKTHESEGYHIYSISDTKHDGFVLWSECRKEDKNGVVHEVPWCIGSAFISGLSSDDNLLHSQYGLIPKDRQSYNSMVDDYPKKGKGYKGAGAERNTFQYIFNIIKGATKNSQTLFTGCTNYSFQYTASVERSTNEIYFPLTNAQASSVVVGSIVSVGYGYVSSDKIALDRSNVNLHKYADRVKVTKIENLDDNNKAVYLDIAEGFNTTPVNLTDALQSPIYISAMPWYAGSTVNVKDHHDGSLGSNTNSKYPYRVQGREYSIGTYTVASDTVMINQSDASKKVYVAPDYLDRTKSDSVIASTYKEIGTIPNLYNSQDYWIGDVEINLETGVFYPISKGESATLGCGDRLYFGGNSNSGTREFLQGGHLGDGSIAGTACLACWYWLGTTGWHCCGCD